MSFPQDFRSSRSIEVLPVLHSILKSSLAPKQIKRVKFSIPDKVISKIVPIAPVVKDVNFSIKKENVSIPETPEVAKLKKENQLLKNRVAWLREDRKNMARKLDNIASSAYFVRINKNESDRQHIAEKRHSKAEIQILERNVEF